MGYIVLKLLSHFLQLITWPFLIGMNDSEQLRSVSRHVILNYFKSCIYVSFHIFMIDQVLFELIGDWSAQNFNSFHLTINFLPNLQNFFINVST
jgi:hypothetical protein